MSRYDYVKYDDQTSAFQAEFKNRFEALSTFVDSAIGSGRASSLVHTKLEEAYMWVGKALRDKQIAAGSPSPLQEERGNS